MITYTIKETNEDIKKAVIVKTGHETEFTLERVAYNEEVLLKNKREVDATLKHHQLIIDNVIEHNPFIKDLTDEQQHAVHMYYESNSVKRQCEDKLNEIGTNIFNSAMEVAEIKKQLGIVDEPSEPVNVENVVEEVTETK